MEIAAYCEQRFRNIVDRHFSICGCAVKVQPQFSHLGIDHGIKEFRKGRRTNFTLGVRILVSVCTHLTGYTVTIFHYNDAPSLLTSSCQVFSITKIIISAESA